MKSYKTTTPHAAVKIWNYVDRITAEGADQASVNLVDEEIVSTLSCTSIQVNKFKTNPVGSFSFRLAPTRNWTAVITPGSWCAIMMSNTPITQKDFKKANPTQVKMIGKIETVRTQVYTDIEGARQTQYIVSGEDWGHVFNNTVYVDPLISDQQEKKSIGNEVFQAFKDLMFRDGSAAPKDVNINVENLLSLFSHKTAIEGVIPRLAKTTHSIVLPRQMVSFLGWDDSDSEIFTNGGADIFKNIKLTVGLLNEDSTYNSNVLTGKGWIDPFSLVGSNSLWQILQDNSNYCLNEMFNEIGWEGTKLVPTLYNRIKPFAYNPSPIKDAGATENYIGISMDSVRKGYSSLRSMFKNVPYHRINETQVTDIDIGTNWRDKVNFIEIKPDMSEFKVHDNWVKQKVQRWDGSNDVFDREGFRPLIFNIRQLPVDDQMFVDFSQLVAWLGVLQEWHFDTHRMLNGTLSMTGSDEYISVGNNIMFNAELIGVKKNLNSKMKQNDDYYVLAHIESVQHAFSVVGDGSRTYQTNIMFSRGIIVDANRNFVGVLDKLSTDLSKSTSKNNATVVATASADNIVGGE